MDNIAANTAKTHIFTSCTVCYIPKARVLAKSLKKFHPEIQFHLILSDLLPDFINLEKEDFDSIITVEELNIPDLKQWIFKHSVVEMCTAVKGVSFQEIFNRYDNCEQVIFFDPDIAIFSRLDELLANFEHNSILLTPHQLDPEKTKEIVIDNEICFLRHGVFNLGFLGVKNSPEGKRFLDWWSNRCLNFCYDDTPNALFTDQRWIDLVPTFFTEVGILRNPVYNVANWNLTNREVIGSLETGIFVNNKPLCFYHFSGSQNIMSDKHNVINSVTNSLLKWYQQQCEEMGQSHLKNKPCFYSFFDNGETITVEQRLRYRHDHKIQEYFPEPFKTTDESKSYFHWYQLQKLEEEKQKWERDEFVNRLKNELEQNRALIEGMESSKFWKIRNAWFAFKKLFGLVTE